MEENKEVLETQNTPVVETPKVEVEKVELSKAELEDLKHKADVSSQNFERAKKAESEVKELREQLQVNEVPSEDESTVHQELSEIKAKLNKSETVELYPVLKELWTDFEEYHDNPDNKGMNMKTAAKAFLVEKGLLEPQRKGLEKPTGGTRAPISVEMKPEDIKILRETNYKKYYEMIKKGQIRI